MSDTESFEARLPPKPAWTLSIPAIVALIAMFGSIAGAALTWTNKGRELDIRMIDISLSILKGENKGTQTEEARRFALRVLEKYSGVDISDEDFDSWVEKGGLELGVVPTYSSYNRSFDYGGGWDSGTLQYRDVAGGAVSNTSGNSGSNTTVDSRSAPGIGNK